MSDETQHEEAVQANQDEEMGGAYLSLFPEDNISDGGFVIGEPPRD